MFLVHSGTVSTMRTRGFSHPAYNLIHVEGDEISIELRVPGGESRSLGAYPRDWPSALSARQAELFAERLAREPGAPLVND
jgi:hypothetical protein